MEFRDSPNEIAFRKTVSDFLDNEYPAEMAERPTEWGLFNGAGRAQPGFREWMRDWTAKLNERGWGAPAWPKEHGGGGLSVKEQFILSEEFAWRRAPRSGGIGHGWAGPTMMVYGSEEQKANYLPKIISGEHTWCQLFSEPGAGSDLASLQTRAIRDGDDYVVNGQKIWTSGAQHADMGILIARTNPDAPKHRGISYFLLDMKTPGVQVRPLYNMLNSHEFNEVYFEDVRIPATNLLGEENRGWYLATTTLDFERSGIATSVAHQLIARDLVKFAKESQIGRETVAANRAARNELADRMIEAQVEALICYRIISMQERGEIPNKESSIAKLYSSELDVRLASTAMNLGGLHAQTTDRDDLEAQGGKFARFYLHSTTSPIGGGTSEIQRNIIAMRGLGLPGDSGYRVTGGWIVRIRGPLALIALYLRIMTEDDGVSIVCAWCTSVVASRGAQVSHGICVDCAMEFIKKLPKEYLASIADPDGTVTLFSDQRLDIETGLPR